MSLTRDMTKILVCSNPAYAKFVKDGKIIVKLQKSLYGLKQAPLNFYQHLRRILLANKFSCAITDCCVFTRKNDNSVTNLIFHVDDILLSSNDSGHVNELKTVLNKEFGDLKWSQRSFSYLGCYINRNDDFSVSVDMAAYCLELSDRYESLLLTKKNVSTPSGLNLFKENGRRQVSEENASIFKSAVMALMYCTSVRLDILKEVIFLSSKTNPTEDDWDILRRILTYVSRNPHLSIRFGTDDLTLAVYCDASYADHEDCKSHTGIFVTLGKNGGPLLVKSKRQSLVTLSSTEAEMVALTDAVTKALPIFKVMNELGFNVNPTIKVYQDNLSTMYLVRVNEGIGSKAKHFRVRYNFLKELSDDGMIQLLHCPTDDMIADLFTKPMVGKERLRQMIRAMYAGDVEKFYEISGIALKRVSSNRDSTNII